MLIFEYVQSLKLFQCEWEKTKKKSDKFISVFCNLRILCCHVAQRMTIPVRRDGVVDVYEIALFLHAWVAISGILHTGVASVKQGVTFKLKMNNIIHDY